MSYTVLARKYRPQTFRDLVGQEHVTRTLGNAIATGRVAHAFLFTGVRGVGKTTSARILAKSLNCEKGPTAEPCNVCDICRDITAGNDLDVLEIDGASNNSVDDVRRLQESIPFRPARDRFKIFIVDEVHMLSTSAFNAFLKTLEEPPPHVKFIFATTEIHKVPVTIRSRCQRYDFRLIPQNVVAGRVREILTAEQIDADDQAVAIVAREAAGSMRDALTLLDQIVAFGGSTLRGAEVARVLGLADRAGVFDAAEAVVSGDAKKALEAVDTVAKQGGDIAHFTKALLELFRDLVVLRVTSGDRALVDLVDEELARAETLAKSVDALELERAFAGLAKLLDEVAKAAIPRVVLEMGLVRLATRPKLTQVSELIAKIEEIERRGGGGGGSGGGPGGGGPSRGAPGGPGPRPGTPPMKAAPPASASHPGHGAPSPLPASPARAVEASPQPSSMRSAPPAAVAPAHGNVGSPSAAAAQATPSAPSGHAPQHHAPPGPPLADSTPASATPPEPQAAAAPSDDEDGTDGGPVAIPASPMEAFERVVFRLRDRSPAVAAVAQHGVAVVVSAAKIVLAFPDGSFFVHQAKAPETREAISDAAQAVFGVKPAVEITTQASHVATGPTIAQLEQARVQERKDAQRARALGHPRVVEAMQVFPESAGAVQVVEVE